MDVEEEKSEGETEEDTSEYEEYTDSEEETGPRLKPVFVRKYDSLKFMIFAALSLSPSLCLFLCHVIVSPHPPFPLSFSLSLSNARFSLSSHSFPCTIAVSYLLNISVLNIFFSIVIQFTRFVLVCKTEVH